MTTQLILARTAGGGAALFVNQAVVLEAKSTEEVDRLVVSAAHKLSAALGVPLVECLVDALGDGNWVWPDLVEKLAPVAAHLEKQPFLVYCWEEGGSHADTEQGPGDAWDNLCFDTQPPMAGTPYLILAPIHETRNDLDVAVRAKLLEDFKHWLNDWRQQDVSSVFHDIVARVESLIKLSPVQPDADSLIEQVSMELLGKPKDPAPGMNWQCDRQWRVDDVRKAVRGALEAANIIAPEPSAEPKYDGMPLAV